MTEGRQTATERCRARLDAFLRGVERRAFKMAAMAVGNDDEALDIVQDVMIAFVRRYGRKPEEQWPPLFFRSLENRIRDWYRRQKVRTRWMVWLDRGDRPAAAEAFPDRRSSPGRQADHDRFAGALESALRALPHRQRQAFLYRTWQGLSVAETATVMGCGQGSVKTHLSRAMKTLREALEEFQP